MTAYTLVIILFGVLALTGLAVWARMRDLHERIRHLEAERAAWMYRTRLYGGALDDIRGMHCPPSTLADARQRAGQALDTLVEVAR